VGNDAGEEEKKKIPIPFVRKTTRRCLEKVTLINEKSDDSVTTCLSKWFCLLVALMMSIKLNVSVLYSDTAHSSMKIRGIA